MTSKSEKEMRSAGYEEIASLATRLKVLTTEIDKIQADLIPKLAEEQGLIRKLSEATFKATKSTNQGE